MMSIIALFSLDGAEIILILTLPLILFGAKRLPGLAEGFGRGLQEFLKATRELSGSDSKQLDLEHSRRRFGPPALMALTFLFGAACLILMVYELSK